MRFRLRDTACGLLLVLDVVRRELLPSLPRGCVNAALLIAVPPIASYERDAEVRMNVLYAAALRASSSVVMIVSTHSRKRPSVVSALESLVQRESPVNRLRIRPRILVHQRLAPTAVEKGSKDYRSMARCVVCRRTAVVL